jgi:hypothetical protein
MATPTGDEATLPAGVTGIDLPSARIRFTHTPESGTQASKPVAPFSFDFDRRASVTWYESRAVTWTSRQLPSDVTSLSRA